MGFPEPVGAILHKYQPKGSHMELFQSIFNDFVHFPSIFAAFPSCIRGLEIRYSYAPPQKSFIILRDLVTCCWGYDTHLMDRYPVESQIGYIQIHIELGSTGGVDQGPGPRDPTPTK